MKHNLKKIFAAFCLAAVMATALTGCGGGDKPAASGAGSAGSSASVTAELSEEEYVTKVKDFYEDVTKISTEAMSGVDATDPKATIDATKGMIEQVTPLYEELGALNAPAAYKDQQAKIKAGCDASVETLQLSMEMLEMSTSGDTSSADAQAKLTELTEKMQGLTAVLTDFQTALTEITSK